MLESKGPERVQQLLALLDEAAHRNGVELPFTATTPYINTIPRRASSRAYPGNRELERRIKSIVRWNAMAMVTRANRDPAALGGHISTYASSATLYEVALNHFIRGRGETATSATRSTSRATPRPGMYARAFLEGRLTEAEPDQFPPGTERRGRLSSLSASLADARLLGVPHRLDGPGADHGDLPGAVQSST